MDDADGEDGGGGRRERGEGRGRGRGRGREHWGKRRRPRGARRRRPGGRGRADRGRVRRRGRLDGVRRPLLPRRGGDAVDPAEFDRSRLDRDPAGFWRDRALHGRMYAADPEPNAAHEALAAVERAGHLDAVVTQNVDGRHGAAGSTTVDRHGNGSRVVPERCGERAPAGPARETPRAGDVPRCDCGGLRRPDVVLFGETLPDGALERAQSLAIRAGAFLAVGSSLSVEPAASLPRLAARTGTLVVVNLDPTPLDSLADHVLRADVVEALPAVASGLAAGVGDGNGAGDGG